MRQGEPDRVTIYRGFRRDGGRAVVTVDGVELDPRLDLWAHSPDGFDWGFGGSGPAQLALALLAAELSDDVRAIQVHQAYKWRVVVRWERSEPWSLTSDRIRATVAKLEDELAHDF
jgi:Family of unknown function (DUF6166)